MPSLHEEGDRQAGTVLDTAVATPGGKAAMVGVGASLVDGEARTVVEGAAPLDTLAVEGLEESPTAIPCTTEVGRGPEVGVVVVAVQETAAIVETGWALVEEVLVSLVRGEVGVAALPFAVPGRPLARVDLGAVLAEKDGLAL